MTVKKLVNVLVIVALISLAALATAGEPKTYRVGLIVPYYSQDRPQVKALLAGLKEAGYIEGVNLRLEFLHKVNLDELRALVKTKIHNYELVVAYGTAGAAIAKEATENIPIVFVHVSAPVEMGLVKSLARPGTNFTGLTFGPFQPGAFGKTLEIFKEAVPTLRRVALLYDVAHKNPYRDVNITEGRKIAAHLGLELAEKQVKSLAEGERVIASLSRPATEGLAIICSAIIYGSKKIAEIAKQKRIAYLGCVPNNVTEHGALLSYGPNLNWFGQRAAWYVDQILKGANPRILPVEGPRKFELAINLRTAKEIGVQIPAAVLLRADEVIE